MTKVVRKCAIITCDNPATPKTQFCENCGANVHTWLRRRPAERLQRKAKLMLYNGRMDTVLEGGGIKKK